MNRKLTTGALLLVSGSLACTAQISGESGGAGSGGATSAGSAGVGSGPSAGVGAAASQPSATAATLTDWPTPSACVSGSPGPRVLRRLGEAEYQQSLKDVFGSDVPATTIFSDKIERGYARDTQLLTVQDLAAQQLMANAETIAAWAVPAKLGALTSCNDAGCASTLVRDFGARLFRAPLNASQEGAYSALFSAEPSFDAGARVVLTAMLQSPYFLYHRELGVADGAGQFKLTHHELASSLSFLLSGGPPDSELRAAADASLLGTREQLAAQAERLLGSPAGARSIYRIVSGWLGLDRFERSVKDDTVFDMPTSLRDAMAEETRTFVVEQVLKQRASVPQLLRAESTFQSPELAAYYAAAVPRDRGLLSLGSLLTGFARADTSSPVQRGRLVRTQLLCQALPPPPQNVDTNLKPAAAGVTTRQLFELHTENPSCAGCHELMDPIGFAFEHYDAFGRYREVEQGQPIDASGHLTGGARGDIAFDGLTALSQTLAESEAATLDQCALRYLSYYAFGSASWPEDWCTLASIAARAEQDGFSLRAILQGIVESPRFSQRTADP